MFQSRTLAPRPPFRATVRVRSGPGPRAFGFVSAVALAFAAAAGNLRAQTPVNAWVEAGGGVVKLEGHRVDFGARGSVHLFYGDWGLSGRALRATPTQDDLGIPGGHLNDPSDEITEWSLSAERVLSSANNSIFYVGAGVARRTGEEWVGIEGGLDNVSREDIELTGWTLGMGFRSQLGTLAGVGGSAAFSSGDDLNGQMLVVSVTFALGKLAR